jgi:hypothetical protein
MIINTKYERQKWLKVERLKVERLENGYGIVGQITGDVYYTGSGFDCNAYISLSNMPNWTNWYEYEVAKQNEDEDEM